MGMAGDDDDPFAPAAQQVQTMPDQKATNSFALMFGQHRQGRKCDRGYRSG